MKKRCETCGKGFEARQAYINYGRAPRFCSQACFGLSRRKEIPPELKKERKRLYDIEYRKRMGDTRLADKRAYYRANRDRFLAIFREKRKTPEYKRAMRKYLATYWTPELKAQKRDYDRKFRAQKQFGPLWEVHYLTVLINEEVKSRMSNYEIRLKNGTLNKALMRSRNGEVKRSYT